MTNGKSTYDHDKTMPSANEAKKQRITMLSIDVTLRVDMQELIDVASEMPKSNTTGCRMSVRKECSSRVGHIVHHAQKRTDNYEKRFNKSHPTNF